MTEPAKDEAELLKWMARGICCGNHIKCPDRVCGRPYLDATAALAAIRAAGWAVAPVEPTDEMMWAADRALAPTWEINNPDDLDFVLFAVRRAEWSAMLAAAPGVKP